MANKISTVRTYPLNGAVNFTITFEYLARKFVKVTLIGKDRKELVLNQDYRFTTKTQITTSRTWTAADGYQMIEIRRFTSATDRLVDFADGSILRAYDLNIMQVQTLHVAEEARDLTADTIGVNNDGHLDARGRRIVNLANAVDDGDAVPLGQLKTMGQNSWQARNEALQFRNEAETFRNQAEGFKNESGTNATNTYKWRNEAEGFRDEAEQFKNASGQYADAAGSYAGNAKDSEDEARRIAASIRAAGLFGYITRQSFEKGFNLTVWNEVLLWEEEGEYYRWDGTLPKNVPAGSTPETSGGIGLGAWVSVGDAALRNELVSNSGAGIVGTSNGNTVQETLDFINNVQQAKLHPFVPSGDFGSGLLFDSSLQVFKYNDEYYSYKGPIVPGSTVPANPSLDANWKKEPVSDHIENYGGGVHVADQTPAILKAIAAGVRRIVLPKGELRMSPCTIPGYTQGLTFVGQGANQAYTGTTVIKPLNDNQNFIFSSGESNDGQDSIKFANIQFDGEWRCNHAILHTRGAGWYYEKLTGKRFNTWFIYDGQGLARFRDIYCEATDASDISIRATGGGIRVYSDSVLDTVEVYGGSCPLRLSAGGNRANNIFCNGGYDVGAIALEPQDTSTNHINTALSNIYIGESTNTSGVAIPILALHGNSVRKVKSVQISNAHFVHASTALNTNMTVIRADKVDGFVMSSFDVLAMGEYSTPSRRTYNFLNATNSTSMAFSAGSVRGVNNNPIVLSSGSRLTIDAVEFNGWGTNSDSGIENKAAIRSFGVGTRCYIGSSCVFNASQAESYAVYAGDEFAVDVSILNLNYARSDVILPANANYSYMFKRSGGKLTLVNTFTQ